jgi:hypothetical protein
LTAVRRFPHARTGFTEHAFRSKLLQDVCMCVSSSVCVYWFCVYWFPVPITCAFYCVYLVYLGAAGTILNHIARRPGMGMRQGQGCKRRASPEPRIELPLWLPYVLSSSYSWTKHNIKTQSQPTLLWRSIITVGCRLPSPRLERTTVQAHQWIALQCNTLLHRPRLPRSPTSDYTVHCYTAASCVRARPLCLMPDA